MKKLALITAGAALLALPAVAASRITANTFEPTAELSKQGRRAEVGVQLGCDRTQRVKLRVAITQTSGAFAQGRRRVRCRADRTFAVTAELRRRKRLRAGDATACGLALAGDDARQWCKDITLVE